MRNRRARFETLAVQFRIPNSTFPIHVTSYTSVLYGTNPRLW